MGLTLVHADSPGQAATREQLLAAAEEVFAAVGFRAATVRDICQRAGANIAAVNYHFGDKEALYTEVLQEALRRAKEKYPPGLGLKAGAGAEQRLRAFVLSFLLRIFDAGPQAHHGKLMAREMADPTRALDALVEQEIRPMCEQLHGIIADLLGAAASPESVRVCSMSVIGQVLFYHHSQPVIRRISPDLIFNPGQIERLAEHITRFSLAGIGQLAKRQPPAGKPRARRRKS